MNEENLQNPDLYLFDVKSLKDELTREDLLAFLKEDWEGFGQKDEVRYGRD